MRLILIVAAALALFAGGAIQAPAAPAIAPAKTKAKAATLYECGMCKIMTAKPGKCPVCGMTMAKASPSKAATAKYECKMCGIMNAKGGKCPKCGMTMTPIAAKTPKAK